MTDLEITRLCAEAMGYGYEQATNIGLIRLTDTGHYFDPLHDDAQAMALVKRFHLHIGKTLRLPNHPFGKWFVSKTDQFEVPGDDLNRAICECVAKMQQAKAAA